MYPHISSPFSQAIQSQKAESDKMKAKLRRLEEDNTKKDRQIEQLLDPAKVMSSCQQIQQQRWAWIVYMSYYIPFIE